MFMSAFVSFDKAFHPVCIDYSLTSHPDTLCPIEFPSLHTGPIVTMECTHVCAIALSVALASLVPKHKHVRALETVLLQHNSRLRAGRAILVLRRIKSTTANSGMCKFRTVGVLGRRSSRGGSALVSVDCLCVALVYVAGRRGNVRAVKNLVLIESHCVIERSRDGPRQELCSPLRRRSGGWPLLKFPEHWKRRGRTFVQAPHQPGQPGFKFTVAESCDRIKDEFQFLQAQYHSLKVEYDKLANEKTEMQRHYVMGSMTTALSPLLSLPPFSPSLYLPLCADLIILQGDVAFRQMHGRKLEFDFLSDYYEMSYGLNIEMHKQSAQSQRCDGRQVKCTLEMMDCVL
ncbi:hypothetical protein DNTS_030881 [Danionella cerebrum]|uniref:Groucho/TLE N-terminal Q-rich domain-containing protein n=1 Tax=Danionella cerebrum TaxID=2873325 RepID=A0A553RMW1_9TELE|nr:hypothetical protein DNTS_030881 [Danionella translucida]